MTMATLAKNNYDYKIHPNANLFPTLSPEDFKELKSDIETHGQQEPIMLSADGTTLLDGRHRLRACKELGIQPRVERFDGAKLSEADFIWAKNILRRHLSADQRAMLAVDWLEAEKEASKDRQRQNLKRGSQSPEGVKTPPRGKTRKAVAEKAHVSEHKVRQAETVRKHGPELESKVGSGELKLKDAVKEITVRPEVMPAPPREMLVSVNFEKPSEPEVNQDPDGATYTIWLTLPKGGNIRQIQAAMKSLPPGAAFEIEKDEEPGSRADRLSTAIRDAQSTVEELKQELESWKENLPENLQNGQKAQELETAIEQLDEVIGALDEASTAADSVEFPGMF